MHAVRILATIAIAVVLAVLPEVALAQAAVAPEPGPVAPTADGPYTPPATTKITPYVAGRTLTWSSFDQLAGDGTVGPDDAVALRGVTGGAPGIVETGTDVAAGQAASWTSSDGGASWTEHLVPSAVGGFGAIAAHGGRFVTMGRALWSSTDGATWTRAASGPHASRWATLAAGPQGFVVFVRNGSSKITTVWRSSSGTSWVAAPVQRVVSGFCPIDIAATSARIIAIGTDCGNTSHPRVLVSTSGRTWAEGHVPAGLRSAGADLLPPAMSVSYVSGRYLLTGSNSTRSATWVWSTHDGLTWHHVSTMADSKGFGPDSIVRIVRLAPGWLAIGHRGLRGSVDDAALVVWRSSDLVHWSRLSPATAGCDATVHMVAQATLIRDRLVAVGTPWGMTHACGETWIGSVTP